LTETIPSDFVGESRHTQRSRHAGDRPNLEAALAKHAATGPRSSLTAYIPSWRIQRYERP